MSPSATHPPPAVDNAAAARAALAQGGVLGLRLKGGSMRPFLRSGDFLEIQSFSAEHYHLGDVLLFETGGGRLLVHRLVRLRRAAGEGVRFLLQGDAVRHTDGWIGPHQVLGRVMAVTRARVSRAPTAGGLHRRRLDTSPARLWACCLAFGLPLAKYIYRFFDPRHRG